MSAAKHTPGPWVIDPGFGQNRVADADGICVGFSWGRGEEAEANAHVFAASPELLELARQYLSDMRHPPAPDSRERRIALIEKVIAKAEGRA